MKTQWYRLSAADALKQLGTDSATGLSSAEAQARLAKAGPNELVERGGRTRREIIVEQLTGVLTILLFIAALVSAVLGDWIEAVVILVIVVLNAVLGYVQEVKAEQSMEALKRMAVPRVPRAPRRQAPGYLGPRAGARRRGDPGNRQHRAGRRPRPPERQPARRGGRVDRRIRAGGEGLRPWSSRPRRRWATAATCSSAAPYI